MNGRQIDHKVQQSLINKGYIICAVKSSKLNKRKFFAKGQMQLFNTDINDKEDDQQFISKESKFFNFVNSVHVI